MHLHRCGNYFSVGEANIGEKQSKVNQIQSITLCNMYFSKKVYDEAGEFSRIFVLKEVTLHSVMLPLTVSYRKKWGSRVH